MTDQPRDELATQRFFFLKQQTLSVYWHVSDIFLPTNDGANLCFCGAAFPPEITEKSTLRLALQNAQYCQRCLAVLAQAADILLTAEMRVHLGIRSNLPLPATAPGGLLIS